MQQQKPPWSLILSQEIFANALSPPKLKPTVPWSLSYLRLLFNSVESTLSWRYPWIRKSKNARWAMTDYNWSSSITSILELLKLPTLTNHRYISRLHILNKSVYHLTAVQLSPYFLRTQQSTWQYHSLHFIAPSTHCDYFKYNFFQEQFKTGTIYHIT